MKRIIGWYFFWVVVLGWAGGRLAVHLLQHWRPLN